jgi:hypothetical protein
MVILLTTTDYTGHCRSYLAPVWQLNSFLVNDQRDAQIPFYVFISIYNSLHVSSTSCSSSGETNCINTASGNNHSMLVAEMCAGWKKTWYNLSLLTMGTTCSKRVESYK